MAALVAMTTCLAGCGKTKTFDDPEANYTTELLKFVPAKAEVVVTVNSKLFLESLGAEVSADGVKAGEHMAGFAKKFGFDDETISQMNKINKAEGINANAAVMFCDGIRNWYSILAVTDHDKLAEYINNQDMNIDDPEEYDGYKVWNLVKTDGSLVDDKDDGLLWTVFNAEGKDAVMSVQKLKESANDKALPEWSTALLDNKDAEITGLVNINAFGVNLKGLLTTAGIDASLLDGDVAYVGARLTEQNHTVQFALTTYDSEGKPADLLNPQLRQGADFSALSALPQQCYTGLGAAVNGTNLVAMVPQIRQINDPQILDCIKSVRSVALGLSSIDPQLMRHGNIPDMAATATFAPGKAEAVFELLANSAKETGSATIGENEIQMVPPRGETPFSVLRIVRQGDMLMATSMPGATIGDNNQMTVHIDDALIACYQKPGAITGLNVDVTKNAYVVLTPDGLSIQVPVPDQYPGIWAAFLAYATDFFNQL